MKQAIIILSDPKSGPREALSRCLNALAMADECRRAGDELEIVFAGAGTRWPGELSKLDHPANARFQGVREFVKGASRTCASFNETTAEVEKAGVPFLDDNQVEGTAGVASLRRYYADDWQVAQF